MKAFGTSNLVNSTDAMKASLTHLKLGGVLLADIDTDPGQGEIVLVC